MNTDQADPPIVLIALHGYGIDETQLTTLLPLDTLERPVVRIQPRAPIEAPEGGFAWFPVSVEDSRLVIDSHDVNTAIGGVARHIDTARADFPDSPIVLFGYSQGASLAIASAPVVGDRVDHVIAIAGFVPSTNPATHHSDVAVTLGFGTLDPAIDEHQRTETTAWLLAAGANVTAHLEIAPHVISAAHRRHVIDVLANLPRFTRRNQQTQPATPTTGDHIMSDLIVDNQPGRLVLTQPFTSVRGPADVWQQVGPKWHEFDRWASSLDQISATDFDADSNTVGAGRSCSTAIGDLAETVTAYDEDQRLISYQIIEGRPPVAEAITATWNIGPGENEGTAGTISMAIDFIDDAPDGIADMMTEQMGGLVGMIAEELVHFVETGEPHPRKAESTNG